jgi:hypothetical protein
MVDKIYIGNFQKGLVLNPLPFNIDNDSFPTMYNFYTWRGRAKRKRGTTPLGRLQLQVNIPASTVVLTAGSVNLITALGLPMTSSIAPGSISLVVGGQTYTESFPLTGALVGGSGGTGTINYATGLLTITGGGADFVTSLFSYYPGLPVMGLEDFVPVNNAMSETISSTYPLLVAFDTQYSYQNFTSSNLEMTSFYNVNYYKNVPNATYTDGTTPYVAKAAQTPFVWHGQNWQQFWTTNFEQAMWATNGNPGMQVQAITSITWVSATKITFGITGSPAIVGDFVFVNEITGTNSNTINGQTGYVSAEGVGTITVVFPDAAIADEAYTGGIIQYLTTTIVGNTGDGIKWYDGDPTNGTGLPSTSAAGWVNFAPPLSATGQTIDNYNSGNTPFYLVGCKFMYPYKDRILFFGPYISTAANMIAGTKPIYLQDGVIWSWNGSPYYTTSFNATTVPIGYNSILTPGTELSLDYPEGGALTAYYVDQTGLGGYIVAGTSQQIVTLGVNEDVLILGFSGKYARLAYTSNDISPFVFFTVNSELGASATFSSINLDRGVIAFGTYGFVIASQTAAQRIDLQIPDLAFQLQSTNFGVQRINSGRDFYKEWLYFSYCPDNQPTTSLFPTQTFFYNYREETWGIFYENFTHHGSFWRYAGITWGSLTNITWEAFLDPWNSAEEQALFPSVVAGTPQGFVVVKGSGTGEAPTGSIANAVAYTGSNPNYTLITSYNHCVSQSNPTLEAGDYLYITGCLGTVNLNGQIGQVIEVIDSNNFVLDILWTDISPYLGLGVFSRLSQPLLQSKQFPPAWGLGRQVRFGTQQYLMDATANSQVTLDLYLSMDPDNVRNSPGSVTDLTNPNDLNDAIIYSQILYTCPESTNLGLTPSNINLQMPTASTQRQIWHRMNSSMIGDTVQFGITLNDAQMRNLQDAIAEVTLHAAVFDTYPGPYLS